MLLIAVRFLDILIIEKKNNDDFIKMEAIFMKRLLLSIGLLTGIQSFGMDHLINLSYEQKQQLLGAGKSITLNAIKLFVLPKICDKGLRYIRNRVVLEQEYPITPFEIFVRATMSESLATSGFELCNSVIYNRKNKAEKVLSLTATALGVVLNLTTLIKQQKEYKLQSTRLEQRNTLRKVTEQDSCPLCLLTISEFEQGFDDVMQLGCCGQIVCKKDLQYLQGNPCPHCLEDILVTRPVKRSLERTTSTTDLLALTQ